MPHLWFIKWKSIAFTFDFLTTKTYPLSLFKPSVHRIFSEKENHTLLPSVPIRETAKLSFYFSWYFVSGDLRFWKTSKGFLKWSLLFDPIPYGVWKALGNSVSFILYVGTANREGERAARSHTASKLCTLQFRLLCRIFLCILLPYFWKTKDSDDSVCFSGTAQPGRNEPHATSMGLCCFTEAEGLRLLFWRMNLWKIDHFNLKIGLKIYEVCRLQERTVWISPPQTPCISALPMKTTASKRKWCLEQLTKLLTVFKW